MNALFLETCAKDNQTILFQDQGRKVAGDMNALFLETCAKDNQNASDIFLKSLMQIEKVCF